ncbi:MAG: hypothetical protein U5K74_13185 [Gemmatimonadaceae bacterium]|nr:hypothetical protein [Gemmatimonadaceae bacterium]
MRSFRSMLSATISAGALLAVAATPAHADGRPLFTWTGTVDREAIIIMRGASLETRGDGFESYREARFRVTQALPRANGSVNITRADGRGDVEVIQQPTLFNNYTARVRVRDRQGGADRYRLVVSWESARFDGRDDDGRDDGRRGDGRRDDDRVDRGRNDDRWGRNDDVGGRRDAGALRFSGVVDDVAEIRIRGRRVDAITRSGRPLYNVRYEVRGASMPDYALPLDLRRFAGRGNVIIAQYPRAWNNWTTIVRIDDSRGGADGYEFDLRW